MRASSFFTFRNWVASSALIAVSLSPSASAGDSEKADKTSKVSAISPASEGTFWTGSTSLVLAENAARRAEKSKTFSSLAIVAERAPVLPYGRAEELLRTIGDKVPAWKVETKLAERILERATAAMSEVDLSSLGIVTTGTLVGPLRAGTDGGVLAKEAWENGPLPSDLSWGAIEVKPRRFPKAYVTGRGFEFGELVSPRRETCTWVISQFELKKPTTVRMFVAASGSYRWMVDGIQMDVSEEGHRDGIFDRSGVTLDLGPDAHTIGVKNCSGALGDRGNVRVRLEDAGGTPLELAHTPFQGPTTGKVIGWKRLDTPMGKALSEKATTTDLLNNATLRELAGADDARSPKAQGLLDALFQTSSRTPDELGFAAFIAPSASNRTGWLSLLEKEESLKPFVLRRYAVERLRARTPEWAHTVTESRLFGTDREASMIRAEIRLALSPSTSREACTTILAESRDPLASTGEISTALSCANLHLPSEALAIMRKLSERGVVSSGFVLRAGESNHTAAETANRALGTRAVSLSDWESVVPYFASIGKTALAEDTARTLLSLNPNRGGAWKTFANISPPDVAVAAYRRSRELEPGRADLRALMDLLNAKPGQVAAESHQPDEKYLTPSDVLLKRRAGIGNASAPEVTERELHWLRVVTLHPDKRVSQLVQYAKEIVVAPRTDDELVEDLPAEGDMTEILKARVHRKDGGFALPVEQQDGPRPSVHWPELAPGDTIEVVLRSWNTSPVGGKADPPFYFMDYGGASSTKPLLYNEVVVVSPTSSPLHVALANGRPDIDERGSKDGRETVRLVWTKPMNVRDEPLAPPLAEVLPIVVGSTFGSWSDFRAWYEGAVAGFTEPDDQVVRLAKELTKGKTTRADKVSALFNFVADQIRYVNYVSGEAWLPNRPSHLLSRREGDCDDKAILLISLLRAVGIRAEEVLVQTRETGQPAVLRATGAAIPLFDHGIAYLPDEKMYLDATSPQSRLGPVPAMDARGSALRIGSGPAEIVELPASSPDDHGSNVAWKIQLSREGDMTLEGLEKHRGDSAFWLRGALTEEEGRTAYVVDHLLGPWFSGLRVKDGIRFVGSVRGKDAFSSGNAEVSYRASAKAALRRDGEEWVFPLLTSRLTATLAPLIDRTLPINLPSYWAPSTMERTWRIEAPANLRWSSVPENKSVVGSDPRFGSASLTFKLEGNTLVVKEVLRWDEHRISVDRYKAWRSYLSSIDQAFTVHPRLSEKLTIEKGGVKAKTSEKGTK